MVLYPNKLPESERVCSGICSELLHVSDICPFGEYEHGYMVLLVDSKNNIYGVMDDYVERFGNDYFKMLNQLYNR
jgi:hypothetical protein